MGWTGQTRCVMWTGQKYLPVRVNMRALFTSLCDEVYQKEMRRDTSRMLAYLTRDTRNSLSPRSMMSTDFGLASRAIERRWEMRRGKEGLVVRDAHARSLLAFKQDVLPFAFHSSLLTHPPPPWPWCFFSTHRIWLKGCVKSLSVTAKEHAT